MKESKSSMTPHPQFTVRKNADMMVGGQSPPCPIHRRDRPLCHLYQLIHYGDRFAVPPSFK